MAPAHFVGTKKNRGRVLLLNHNKTKGTRKNHRAEVVDLFVRADQPISIPLGFT